MSKINNILVKQGFKFVWTHILSIALTFFLFLSFGWVMQKWGIYYFSIGTSLVYITLIYSDAWNFGRIEGKTYNDIKETPLRALIASLIPTAIGVILVLLLLFNVNSFLVNVIAKAWYLAFLGYYTPKADISVSELCKSIVVLPVTVFIAYFAGMKNFSVLEKLTFLRRKRKKK